MSEKRKSIVFVNQSSGYLMIDTIHAHLDEYDEIILLTGFLNPRREPLDERVKVHFLKEYNRESLLKRMITWSLFYIQACYFIFLKYRQSVVYFVSNPPLNVFIAAMLTRPFAFLVYDIYPDALVEQRFLSTNNPIVKGWSYANRVAFQKADKIYTISRGMKDVISTYVQKSKIEVVPVWSDNTYLKPIPKKENSFLQKHPWGNKFIILYSGNIGLTHPVEVMVEAATLVQEEDILFLIIGEGEKKKELVQQKEEMNLTNVMFLPFQSHDVFPTSLASADIGVVTIGSEASTLSVPSKTYNLMSVGAPILAITDEESELARLVHHYKNGAVYPLTEVEEIASYIEKMFHERERVREQSENSLSASKDFQPDNAYKLQFLND